MDIITTENNLPSLHREKIERLIDDGTTINTKRALKTDLNYFKAWYRLKTGNTPTFPVSLDIACEFITDHSLGLPENLDKELIKEGVKAKPGIPKPSTLERKISSMSTYHKQFLENPFKDERLKLLLAKAKKAAINKGITKNKKSALDKNLMDLLINTCNNNSKLIDVRDKALLLVGFCSGGRRRSEITSLRVEDIKKVTTGYIANIRQSKTDKTGEGLEVPVFGKAAVALEEWLNISGIQDGYIFRSISKGGVIGANKFSDKAVTLIIKKRANVAGLSKEDIDKISAHSLRSGFVTECGKRGINRGDVMALTGHKSVAVFEGYYRSGNLVNNPAANIL